MAIQMETCEHGIIVRFRDGNGAIQSKIVDPEDVADALAKRSKMDTGLLPRNTRYYARLANYQLLVLELPEHICRIEYAGLSTPFDVPVPYLCFFIRFFLDSTTSTYRVLNTNLYAAYGPVLDNDTSLYKFPYGNVYPNGNVCWGSVPPIETASIAELSAVPNAILSSKFNGDLSAGNFIDFADPENNGIHISLSEHLLRYLHGKTSFKYDVLLYYASFGAVLKQLSQ